MSTPDISASTQPGLSFIGRDEPETFNAKVRKVKYSKPDSDFAILELDRLDRAEAIVAVGALAPFREKERLCVTGRFERHKTFGMQLRVQSAYVLAPDSKEAIEEYLVGAKIKGIGAALAKRIVKAFGEDTLRVINEEPERLEEVSGLGERKRGRSRKL